MNGLKKQRADIFISYSHNDVDLVKTFAGWINKKFGLTVFFLMKHYGGKSR